VASGQVVVAEGVPSMRKTTVQNGGFQPVSAAIAMCHKKMMAMRHHALKKVQRLYKNIKLYNFSQSL
jgi:hypothetical protein